MLRWAVRASGRSSQPLSSLRAERRRSVGPLPQILRHGWTIFGEFVVSFTLTDFRGI
jgi:hypothetical protein